MFDAAQPGFAAMRDWDGKQLDVRYAGRQPGSTSARRTDGCRAEMEKAADGRWYYAASATRGGDPPRAPIRCLRQATASASTSVPAGGPGQARRCTQGRRGVRSTADPSQFSFARRQP
jgi:hypothetical protein